MSEPWSWHLPRRVYGQELEGELLVYTGSEEVVRLTDAEAKVWKRAAAGEPVAPANAAPLLQRGLLQKQASWSPESSTLEAFPDAGKAAPHARWRPECIGATYLLDTSSGRDLHSYWFTEPFATFWGVFADQGARAAHRATQERFGEAWTQEDGLAFLGDLQRAGLTQGLPTIASLNGAGKHRGFGELIGIEQVSRQMRSTPVPWYVLWEVTYLCNIYCKTCYATELYNAGDVTLKTIPANMRQVMDTFYESGVYHVTLIGGEPMASPVIFEICEELRRNHVYVKIVSNGTLITDKKAQRLVEAGVNEVNVSVDGFSPEVNDPVRGAGTFKKIRRGVRALLDAGLPRVALSVTAGVHNVDELTELPRLASEIFGVSEVFLTRVICTGDARNVPGWRTNRDLAEELHNLIDNEWPKNPHDVRVWTQRWHCDCARMRCVVSPDGKMRPCTFHPHNVTDLSAGFLNAWQNTTEFDMVRRPYRYNEECRQCDEQLVCKGTACSSRVYARDQQMISDQCIHNPEVQERYGA